MVIFIVGVGAEVYLRKEHTFESTKWLFLPRLWKKDVTTKSSETSVSLTLK
jgi:hypothetical protein